MKKITIILLLVTLPLSSFFMTWSHNVLETYFAFDKIVNGGPKGNRLYIVGLAEYFSLKEKSYSLLGFPKKADVNFMLQPLGIKELNSNLIKHPYTKW